MEHVRKVNRWTQDEDAILIKRLYEQEACIRPSPVPTLPPDPNGMANMYKGDPTGTAADWQKVAAALPGRSNKDCRKRWFNVLSGGLRKGAWTSEEDAYLRDAVRIEGKSWMRVAQHVPQRTADQCAKRWQHFLDPTLDRSEWTADENERLLRAVQQHGRRWLDIRNQYLPLRSPNALKNQYSILLRRHEKSLASIAKKNQSAMEMPQNSYHYQSSSEGHVAPAIAPQTPNNRSSAGNTRKHRCEADGYIKQELDEDIMGSPIYGDVHYQAKMSPAMDYSFIGKGTPTPDPMTGRYAVFPKQEDVAVAEYNAVCFGSSIGTQYGVNPAQFSHMDAGISNGTADKDIWMAYPTSPSSTAPSDGELGGFQPHGNEWAYGMAGMTLQNPPTPTVYAYGGYQ
ncbi:transcriptional activator [Arthroderma uncinatum]|uniref:transcriptional activator n=1 Tax=Arthroderma uncinatum TaxID=74035 RepID=UPI00144AD065|nr:transcriptional activator [Arthroderma uncinatum]KAF3484371.1 transcriptional activator [Arthroderma uncinatum]